MKIKGYNDFHNTSNDEFLTKRRKEKDLEIRDMNIKSGQWVNLNDEFGDVWHEVKEVITPDDYYGSVVLYIKGEMPNDVSTNLIKFYNIRKVSDTLPNDARIAFSSSGII
jgi:hypothetical protein